MEEDNECKNLKKNRIYAALGFGLFCLIVGIPVWWKTTEVYRFGLPYQDIYSFHKSSIKIKINLVILNHDLSGTDENQLLIEKIKSYLQKNMLQSKNGNLIFDYNISQRDAMPQERTILSNLGDNLYSVDRLEEVRFADYFVFVVSHELFADFSKTAIIVGPYIVVPNFNENQISKTVADVLVQNLVHQESIELTFQNAKNNFKSKGEKLKSKSLRSSLSYDVTFTLINPQPDMLSIAWDIDYAINKYLGSMLDMLSNYAEIIIKSQYIYQTSLNVKTIKSGEDTLLPWSSLPHIINSVEPYLNSFVSNGPSLNFVVFVPTRDQTPTYLLDYQGEKSKLNSLVSPRWGGVLVYNVASEVNVTLPQQVQLDMSRLFGVFAPQLKALLGFNHLSGMNSISDLVIIRSGEILEKTELSVWLLDHCVENIAKSSATLFSLARLLDKIRNIVINDDVGYRVVASLEAMKRSVSFLGEGKLQEAFLQSRSALEASEKAFYDPSILELLYFPEDQKYAIYIPLFLPIGIPVIQSFFSVVKYFRRKEKIKTE